MNVLLLGSGGREHALAWALKKSPYLQNLFCAPGNPGMEACGTCVPLESTDHVSLIAFCKKERIDLVVVGPEAPLVSGVVDFLVAEDIKVFGPHKKAAQLEGSKAFTKDLCARYNIPTADFQTFSSEEAANLSLKEATYPLVIKADGLAAGKGVIIATTKEEAQEAFCDIFSGKFGAPHTKVVVEDYLEGEEVSFFVLCDGKTVLPLTTAQDHKRVFDGDKGPNTGGMGAYSPAYCITPTLEKEILEKIIHPTISAMEKEGMPFCGVLYAGLMMTQKGPFLIEYNVRFGDPECQTLMMRLQSDLLLLLWACASGTLDEMEVIWHENPALAVVLAAPGYPDCPQKGLILPPLSSKALPQNTEIFHAGTSHSSSGLVSSGGRVLTVVSRGETFEEARRKAYEGVSLIGWEQALYRKDIGWRAFSFLTEKE